MKHLSLLFGVAVLLFSGSTYREVAVSRDELGRAKEGVHVNVALWSINSREFYVRLYTADANVGADPVAKPDHAVRNQLTLQDAEWHVMSGNDDDSNKKWLCRFIENRDGFYHTIVKLPISELRRSKLIYNVQLNNGERRQVVIDLGKMDWERSSTFVWQNRD